MAKNPSKTGNIALHRFLRTNILVSQCHIVEIRTDDLQEEDTKTRQSSVSRQANPYGRTQTQTQSGSAPPWNALCFFLEKSTSRANGTERNGKRANFGATNDLILAVFFFVQMHSH